MQLQPGRQEATAEVARTSHLRDCAVTAVFGLTASHLVSLRCSRSVELVQPKARIKVVAPDSTNTALLLFYSRGSDGVTLKGVCKNSYYGVY